MTERRHCSSTLFIRETAELHVVDFDRLASYARYSLSIREGLRLAESRRGAAPGEPASSPITSRGILTTDAHWSSSPRKSAARAYAHSSDCSSMRPA
jgi:hypothetical protein